MKDITVKKDELLKILQENRANHVEIFNEAVEGYKAEAEKILSDHLDRVRSGKMTTVYVSLPVPENHTKDYDRIIKMVEMHQDHEFILSERDVQSYVMDDWDWTKQFLTSSARYSGTAATSLEAYS